MEMTASPMVTLQFLEMSDIEVRGDYAVVAKILLNRKNRSGSTINSGGFKSDLAPTIRHCNMQETANRSRSRWDRLVPRFCKNPGRRF
jgi:hypothetical protein